MSNSRNSRKGIEKSGSDKKWKKMVHQTGRTNTRSVLSKQKFGAFVGTEDLPHRHEYSDKWFYY